MRDITRKGRKHMQQIKSKPMVMRLYYTYIEKN